VTRHALVLAAGLGTRLRPFTSTIAKPAIPVAGEPLIRRIVRRLVEQGVDDLVVNLHYLPQTITGVLGDGADLGARIRYSWEFPVILGSAGGPRRALPLIGAKTFFIVNGDTLTDVDLAGLAAAHESSGALATLAVTPNAAPLKYGGATMRGDEITGFVARGEGAAGSFHFLSVQVAEADAFAPLPDGQPASTVRGIYDELIAARPGSIRGYRTDAAFWDIGTVEDYIAVNAAFDPDGRYPVPAVPHD
jgi:NDP-sugar pyrophosphorylase family protein